MFAILGGLGHADSKTILDIKKGELGINRANALIFHYPAKLSRGLKRVNGVWTLEAATSMGVWTYVNTKVSRVGEITKNKLLPVEYESVKCFEYAPDGQLGQASSLPPKVTYLCKFKDDFGTIYYSTSDEYGNIVDSNKLVAGELDSLVAFLATNRGKIAQFPLNDDGPSYNYRYEVRFDGQGADSKLDPDMIVARPDRLTFLPDPPSRAGYVFDGWYTGIGGKGKPVNVGTRLDSDTVVYANWLKPYSVSFDGNGGVLDPQPAPMTATAKKGIEFLPPEPTREGYFFGGWCFDKEGSRAYVPLSPVSADTVLYAKWTKYFEVTFDGNGADPSFQPVPLQAGPKGLIGPVPTPTRDGYKFGGWFNEKDGGVEVVQKTAIDRDTTVYAEWLDYDVGDKGPAGGLIFYVNDDPSLGWHYLEAAPGGNDVKMVWGKGESLGTPVDLDTSEEIGSGRANSDLIAAYAGPGAAMNSHNLSIGGYTDWFYPSRNELLTMYSEFARRGLLGSFDRRETYWSSSRYKSDDGCAYAVDFASGGRPCPAMNEELLVRPVRAFGWEKGCEASAPAAAIESPAPANPAPKANAQLSQVQTDAFLSPGVALQCPSTMSTKRITKFLGQ
jgi:uncharacterized repeat protein (TIGR02543 family)